MAGDRTFPVHFFRCNHCEQKLRLGITSCGSCGRPVTLLNWITTHLVLLTGIMIAGVYLFSR